MATARSLRIGSALACAVFSGLTAAAVILDRDGWGALASWLAALWTATLSVPGDRAATRLSKADAMPLLGVTLLALALRGFRITEIPFGLWIDEAATVLNAIALAESDRFLPFGATPLFAERPDWVHTSNLYLYVCSIFAGSGVLGAKLISVIPGVLAVPGLYLLARSLFERPFACLAAGLLAASAWHTTLSRWGWDEVLATTLCVVSFHFVYRGIRDDRPRDALLGGIVAGLALYSYAAAQVALFAALGLLLLRALQTRTHGADRQLLGFLAGAAVAALPLFASWALAPELPGVRMRELAAIAGQDQGPLGVLTLLGSNLGRHLWMFHGAGDPNPRHNLSGEPMLDLATGVLFALGTLLAIREFRRAESQLCLVWLGAGLMAGVLSSQPAESPHAYRTGFVAPVCCLLAARGAVALWGRTRGRFPPSALWAGVILLLALTSAGTAWDYFHLRPGAPESWSSAREGVAARLIRERVAQAHARNQRVTLESQLRTASLELELLLLRDRRGSHPAPPTWTDFAGSWERVEQTLDSGVRAVVVMRPELRDEALRRLPQHDHGALLDPFDSVVAITVESRP